MRRTAKRRCVLLFAVSAAEEARAKRLGRAGLLIGYARRRLAAAVAELPAVDLLTLPQHGGSFGERLENASPRAARPTPRCLPRLIPHPTSSS